MQATRRRSGKNFYCIINCLDLDLDLKNRVLVYSISGISHPNPFLWGNSNAFFMLIPESICIPNLNAYLAKCASVSRCKDKLVIYSFASLAVCDFDTWQFSRMQKSPYKVHSLWAIVGLPHSPHNAHIHHQSGMNSSVSLDYLLKLCNSLGIFQANIHH